MEYRLKNYEPQRVVSYKSEVIRRTLTRLTESHPTPQVSRLVTLANLVKTDEGIRSLYAQTLALEFEMMRKSVS
jgi:hypothetical protein